MWGKRKRFGRSAAFGVAWILLIALIVQIIRTLATSKAIHYGVIKHYLFSSTILHGVLVTVELTAISMAIGLILGLILALMRLAKGRVLQRVASLYIWFFRGSPVLVQLIFWFNLGLIFKTISIGIPFGPTFASVETNTVITGFTAAILGLGLNEGAYMAEIIRSGIMAVSKGQHEAARALGMSPVQVMRIVVLPQALRVAVPPTGNQLINMFKVTSLVSVIGGGDVLTNAENLSSQNFFVIELLIVATLWYLLLTSASTVLQRYLERRLSPDEGRNAESRSRRAERAAKKTGVFGA